MSYTDPHDRATSSPFADTPALLSDILTRITHLLRGEFDLARAEMQENVKRAMVGIGLLAGSAVVGFTALHVLAGALVAAIAELGLGGGWAALIVGAVFLVIALICALWARRDLKTTSFAPTRSIKSIRRDATAAREARHD